jgi:hypothetical protein
MNKKFLIPALLFFALPTAALAKPQGFYAGVHYGGIDGSPAGSGPGMNMGYQGDSGWGVHGEFTRDTLVTFGGVFGTYRTSGDVYFLAKGGVTGGRSTSGIAGGVGIGVNAGSAFNVELDANAYGDRGVANLRLSYSF